MGLCHNKIKYEPYRPLMTHFLYCPSFSWSHPLIIAHRGDRVHAPENTLPAFKKGMEAGAAMLELDLTLTKDREIVIIHDETLDRTTDGKGKVSDFTLKELKALDAGSWFGPEFKGVRIPTLRELFEAVGGEIMINLEIKPEAYEAHNPPDRIGLQVLDMIEEFQIWDHILISSFHPDVLLDLSRQKNCPPLGYLVEDFASSQLDHLKEMKAFSLNCEATILAEEIAQVKALGCRVLCYTINDPKELKRLWEAGVDGFFTDDPALQLKESVKLKGD